MGALRRRAAREPVVLVHATGRHNPSDARMTSAPSRFHHKHREWARDEDEEGVSLMRITRSLTGGVGFGREGRGEIAVQGEAIRGGHVSAENALPHVGLELSHAPERIVGAAVVGERVGDRAPFAVSAHLKPSAPAGRERVDPPRPAQRVRREDVAVPDQW